MRGIIALGPTVTLGCVVAPSPIPAADSAFESVRDAIIHIGLGDPTKLKLDESLGTGFLVDDKGTVMTAKHVIADVNDRSPLMGAYQLPGDRSRSKFLSAEVIDDQAKRDFLWERRKPLAYEERSRRSSSAMPRNS